jgi:hypothetical protein
MTYENFKYEIRKLGLYFWISDTEISVGTIKHGNVELLGPFCSGFEDIYCIDTKERYKAHQTDEFYKLEESIQKKLFNLITWLARTPIENRGDLHKETKWYLKHKYLNTWGGGNYLCQGAKFLSLSEKTNNIFLKFKFTRYEIEELAKTINLNEFEKEKVE